MALLEENEPIAEIFLLTRRQILTIGQGQPYDIDIRAVKLAMDLHGITDQLRCLNMVRTLWHHCETLRQEREESNGQAG